MTRGVAMDPARKARLLSAYADGATVRELAARFGVSPHTVSNYVTEAGIARARGSR